MPLLKFQTSKRDISGTEQLRADAEIYAGYAQEARSRSEEELAQFFDELAQFFYLQAEKPAQVASNNSFKGLLRERWHSWKELFDF